MGKKPNEIAIAIGGMTYFDFVKKQIASFTKQQKHAAMAKIKLNGKKYK